MTEHPARAAAAAAHLRELAEATTDPRNAYASPAEIAAVTGSLRELARHLEDALRHLETHVRRRDKGDWVPPDGEAHRPYARQAGDAVQSAQAEARNMVRDLDRAMNALGPFKAAP
ncbi:MULTISPECIES: hypothetical protein [Streptomyces]|uniref:Uncharacterized protein n=1 Tax=Streptomyces virginiae TaxID=1961 RepID=A0ABZ1THR6_STRVG|nr:hypothetical protein [Streptomyces virginiae]WTB24931.1 hypothetical protein OG253_27610 [Streptomyces virginiae]